MHPHPGKPDNPVVSRSLLALSISLAFCASPAMADGTIIEKNTGTITINDPSGIGMSRGPGYTMVNEGMINTGASGGLFGMFAKGDLSIDTNVTAINSGTISGFTVGMLAQDKSAIAINQANGQITGVVNGMMANEAGASAVNEGTISASAAGMVASGDNSLTNAGTINVATGNGMQGEQGTHLTNKETGVINALTGMIVTGEKAGVNNLGTVNAQNGMSVSGANSYGINSGAIDINADNGTGMQGGADTILDNKGMIASSSGKTGSTGIVAEGRATNSGTINSDTGMVSRNDGVIFNKGIINAKSGMFADSTSTGVVKNEAGATINATQAGINISGGGTVEAWQQGIINMQSGGHGILVDGGASSIVTMVNTGVINVSGSGHELHVVNSGAAPVSLMIWSTKLAKDYKPFAVEAGAELELGAFGKGIQLIVRPGEGYQLNTPFRVKDLVAGNGTVIGDVHTLETIGMPMLSAKLDGTGFDNQTITINIDPSKSYGQQANVMAVRNAQNRFWQSSRTVSSALDTAYTKPATEWDVFASTYASNAGSSGDVSAKSDNVGFLIGGTKRISPEFLLGAHVGYEHTDAKANDVGLKAKSDSWLIGLHGSYHFTPNAFMRGQLTGMYSRSDYTFSMGAFSMGSSDSANDKRDEHAVFANLTGGYDFKVNASNTLTPEIGLAYLYLKNPSMNVNWGSFYSDMNTRFVSDSYNAAYATAALRWTGLFESAATQIKPTVALGVRQTLTNGKIHGDMNFVGQRFNSSITDDKTVGTVEAGLQFSQKNMNMAVKYSGNFSSDTHDNIVWAEFGYTF